MKKIIFPEALLNNPVSRRSLLKAAGVGAAISATGCSSMSTVGRNVAQTLEPDLKGADGKNFSPIDRTIKGHGARVFSGDNPDRTHGILWNKSEYIASIGGIPAPTETAELVVVGGGVSGLLTSYLLREHKPIILERADRFGGNARGESWNGLDYSIGAAYFMEQDQGSDLYNLYRELGIDKMYRVKSTDDPVIYKGQRYNSFWKGDTDPQNRDQFLKLSKYFEDTFKSENGLIFPDLPITDQKNLQHIKELDRQTFREHLMKVVGGNLHPHIEAAMEHYCWSSFGAPFCEISAAAGLNFYAAEFGDVYITPGGNSAIAERILQNVAKFVPVSNLRPRSVVFNVSVQKDGAIISYVDANEKPRSIFAKAVVMACPKFVVARVLENIEPNRLDAIKKLRYHSYLVTNVLVNREVSDDFYDLFMIGDGTVDENNIPGSVEKQGVTDIVLGTFSHPGRKNPGQAILTLYRGIPYEGGRGLLYSDGAYAKYRSEFEQQIRNEILPLVGLNESDIFDIRMTRWGHPLPMASRGLIADGTLETVRKPFQNRVFFIEQDNWMLPAFETGTTEAIMQTPAIAKILKGGV